MSDIGKLRGVDEILNHQIVDTFATVSGRIEVDVIRYHHGGWVTGSVTVNGETHEAKPGEWFGFQDHSWGGPAGCRRGTDRCHPGPVAETVTAPPA